MGNVYAQSPMELEIIIHYCYSPKQWLDFNEISQKIHDKLVGNGLLYFIDGKYKPNESALWAYVDALKKVPFPKQEWVIPK
jgi:hypothetical protein